MTLSWKKTAKQFAPKKWVVSLQVRNLNKLFSVEDFQGRRITVSFREGNLTEINPPQKKEENLKISRRFRDSLQKLAAKKKTLKNVWNGKNYFPSSKGKKVFLVRCELLVFREGRKNIFSHVVMSLFFFRSLFRAKWVVGKKLPATSWL